MCGCGNQRQICHDGLGQASSRSQAMGDIVRGIALVAHDGFSARYDLGPCQRHIFAPGPQIAANPMSEKSWYWIPPRAALPRHDA